MGAKPRKCTSLLITVRADRGEPSLGAYPGAARREWELERPLPKQQTQPQNRARGDSDAIREAEVCSQVPFNPTQRWTGPKETSWGIFHLLRAKVGARFSLQCSSLRVTARRDLSRMEQGWDMHSFSSDHKESTSVEIMGRSEEVLGDGSDYPCSVLSKE